MNHLDSDTLLAFREHRLSGVRAAEVAMHVGGCAQCAAAAPSSGKTALEALVVCNHLSDEELDVLVDGREYEPAYRAAAKHAEACAMCRAELADLRHFEADRFEFDSRVASFTARSARRWLMAASIAFAVVALSAIALFLGRDSAPAPSGAATFRPPVSGGLKPAAPQRAVVASLADGNGRIALLDDGAISGVAALSPRDADDVRAVLSGRASAVPTFIAAMLGSVRGGDIATHPPRAVEPFRSAVLDARPRFAWTPVPGAKRYRVAVFDSNYEEIARSEPLTGTAWKPAKPLPAGVDLSWHVVAETETGEISSAGSQRPEAVFRVLPPNEIAEVGAGETQVRDSHLLRGLLYSRHGLLHDAEREFRLVAEQNPGSPAARALVRSVSR